MFDKVAVETRDVAQGDWKGWKYLHMLCDNTLRTADRMILPCVTSILPGSRDRRLREKGRLHLHSSKHKPTVLVDAWLHCNKVRA